MLPSIVVKLLPVKRKVMILDERSGHKKGKKNTNSK